MQGRKGPVGTPLRCSRVKKKEAVRADFDGSVSEEIDDRVKLRSSERIAENAEKMVWKTIVEDAKVLPNDATITQATAFGAVEAAKAICCSLDLCGHLIEEWGKNENRNRKKNRNEIIQERTFHDEEQDAARFSHPTSSLVLASISDSFSVKEMTSQNCCKLGAKPKWAAHADQPSLTCGERLL